VETTEKQLEGKYKLPDLFYLCDDAPGLVFDLSQEEQDKIDFWEGPVEVNFDASVAGDWKHNINEWNLPAGLVTISGDGHHWFCFDCREKTSDPPVIWIETENQKTIDVAPNFVAFLQKLQKEEYEEHNDDDGDEDGGDEESHDENSDNQDGSEDGEEDDQEDEDE